MSDFKKFIWILKNGKPILPFLIFSIILSSFFALIGVFNAFVSKSLIDSAISLDYKNVLFWLTIMGIILFSRLGINFLSELFSRHTSLKFIQALQKKIYCHVTFSRYSDIQKISSMNIITRIQSDVSTVASMLLNTIPRLISLIVSFIASLGALLFLSPTIAIIALVIGPILVVIGRFFSSKLKKLYKEIQENDINYKSFLLDTICNSPIIKSFCLEDSNIEKLDQIQKEKYNLVMKNTKISLSSNLAISFSTSIAYFTIFCFYSLSIAKGVSTYGSMTAMLQLYNNIKSPFQSLAHLIPGFISAISAAERLIEIEDFQLENKFAIDSKITTPTIEFENINFSYTDSKPILKNLNFKIMPGDIVALVGPSGEGKTTIIKLLLSLLENNSGNIFLSDSNAKEIISPIHRELISYVPQGNTLFTGTILDNILLGDPNASKGEIIQTLHESCAYDFINDLEDGIYTKIGEGGSGISEGQAQRISIARAFIRKKPILILDEATSALDESTELKIINSIKSLKHKPTCIIITHRPYALTICNRILRLEKGTFNDIK